MIRACFDNRKEKLLYYHHHYSNLYINIYYFICNTTNVSSMYWKIRGIDAMQSVSGGLFVSQTYLVDKPQNVVKSRVTKMRMGHYRATTSCVISSQSGRRLRRVCAAREKEMSRFTPAVYDVILVGSGIIGLYTAHELLSMGYRVVMVEKADTLCSGATGAGQGYIWMCHRDPLAVGAWTMAMHSKERWKDLLASCDALHASPNVFDDNGSLLISNTVEEKAALEARSALLERHGLCPVYLPSREDVERQEPALKHSNVDITSGIFIENDAQIDGRVVTKLLFTKCTSYGDMFKCIFGNAVQSLYRSASQSQSASEVNGVILQSGEILEANAVVICAGSWSGQLLSQWLEGEAAEVWSNAIVPRRGHLLVMRKADAHNTSQRSLRHGIMESSYTKHYSFNSPAKQYDITFTATENAIDNSLLIGSSRELPQQGQWSQTIHPQCRDDILHLAQSYLPEILKDATIIDTRVGLRPYSLGHRDHRPFIGPVPHTHGLFIAAGHEGSGLTLAPSTADLIIHHLKDNGCIGSGHHSENVDSSILAYTQMFD